MRTLLLLAALACSRPEPVPVTAPPCPVCPPAVPCPSCPERSETLARASAEPPATAVVAPPNESRTDKSLRGRHLDAFESVPAGAALVVTLDAAALCRRVLGDGPIRAAAAKASVEELGLDLTRAELLVLWVDPVEPALAVWVTGDFPGALATRAAAHEDIEGGRAHVVAEGLLAVQQPGRVVLGTRKGVERSLVKGPTLFMDATLNSGHRAAVERIDARDALMVASVVVPPTANAGLPIQGLRQGAGVVRENLSASAVVSGTPAALSELSRRLAALATAARQGIAQGLGARLASAVMGAVEDSARRALATPPSGEELRLNFGGLSGELLVAWWLLPTSVN